MTINIYLGAVSELKAILPLEIALTTLDSHEQEATKRIIVERRLNEFVFARYFAKALIAKTLNTLNPDTPKAANKITFHKNKNGKLFLDNSPLFFNISHSGDFIAIAIAKDFDIGVDIENPTRANSNYLEIAERYFTREEYVALSHLQGKDQEQLFYKIWTLKEAVLKATGDGIVGGLDSIDVLHKATPCLQHCVINQKPYDLSLNYWQTPLHFENTHLSIAALTSHMPPFKLHSLKMLLESNDL